MTTKPKRKVLTVRIPPRLHEAVKVLAHERRTTVNNLLTRILAQLCEANRASRAALLGLPTYRGEAFPRNEPPPLWSQ
ncbi:MAG TPA: toxin-antitoxin system HicB family antitoxin [Thermoguttaceae bacterium]|nr:toxin-antitoxin system HicB family antitoxin [Thermoguttaceae bacterium]